MSKLIRCLLVLPLLAALAGFTGTASARSVINDWRKPGLAPYSTLSDWRHIPADTLRRDLPKIKAPGWAIPLIVAHDVACSTFELEDGMVTPNMLWDGGRVIRNMRVAFGKNAPAEYRKAERCVAKNAATGEEFAFDVPWWCKNLSELFVFPPPPRNPCYLENYDYSHKEKVILERATDLEARGSWHNDLDQPFLYPDTAFAFVVLHIDLNEEEMQRLYADECFGYGDATGFHRKVSYCAESFCPKGSYAPIELIRMLNEKTGERFPETEPPGSFRIPLANGQGYVSYPLWVAERIKLSCVEVKTYPVRYRRWHFYFDFDLVYPEQGRHSVAVGRKKGLMDIPLIYDDNSTRYLDGRLTFFGF